MSEPTITEQALLECLRAAEQRKADANAKGVTIPELRKILGVGEKRARRLVKELRDAGRMEVGQRFIEDIRGTMQPVPVYILREHEHGEV